MSDLTSYSTLDDLYSEVWTSGTCNSRNHIGREFSDVFEERISYFRKND
jgi:hypothetical protein